MLKLVLDTNTIVSGLIWHGNEFQLLERIEAGEVVMFTSSEMTEELNLVMRRPKLQKFLIDSKRSAEPLIEKILLMSELVTSNVKVDVCRDKKDNKFIECALSANADYIVSGDEDLLSLKQFRNIKIVKTTEILKIL